MSNKTIGLLAAGGMVFVSLVSAMILSGSGARADEPVTRSVNASVKVSSSCSMTADTTSPHTATIINGNRSANIGLTTLEVFCNDAGGFAIYAVGYGNNTYGETDLISVTNEITSTISTGTAVVDGTNSSWGMRVKANEQTTYPPTVVDPFNKYSVNEGYVAVPSAFAKIAFMNGTTTTSSGSALDTTYAAYVAPDQAAGTYNGQVMYVMVHPSSSADPVAPELFDLAFISQENPPTKKQIGDESYYVMQDMTTQICTDMQVGAQGQMVDERDNKIYWVSKLKDGHCWMTQNLDFYIDGTELDSTTTDLTEIGAANSAPGAYDGNNQGDAVSPYAQTNGGGYRQSGDVIYWTPTRRTIPTSAISATGTIGDTTDDWQNSQTSPYSVDPGDWYWAGGNAATWYDSSYCGTASPWCNYLNGNEKGTGSTARFSQTPYTANGEHGHVGNYYNWTAAIASNDSTYYDATYGNAGSTMGDVTLNPKNSVCPAHWRLPTISTAASTDEFTALKTAYPNTEDKGFVYSPLFFVRGGAINSRTLYLAGYYGYYWSSTVQSDTYARYLYFNSGGSNTQGNNYRYFGFSLRCLAR